MEFWNPTYMTVEKMYDLQSSGRWHGQWIAFYDEKQIGSVTAPQPLSKSDILESITQETELHELPEGTLLYGLWTVEAEYLYASEYVTGDTLLRIRFVLEPEMLKTILSALDGKLDVIQQNSINNDVFELFRDLK